MRIFPYRRYPSNNDTLKTYTELQNIRDASRILSQNGMMMNYAQIKYEIKMVPNLHDALNKFFRIGCS